MATVGGHQRVKTEYGLFSEHVPIQACGFPTIFWWLHFSEA